MVMELEEQVTILSLIFTSYYWVSDNFYIFFTQDYLNITDDISCQQIYDSMNENDNLLTVNKHALMFLL